MKLNTMTCAVLVSTMFSALVLTGPAQAEKLRMGTEGAYAPFNTIDEKGQVGGFDVEIGNALCAKMQVECEWVTSDWDGIIPALLGKKMDAIVASMSITSERQKSVAFTEPYYSNKLQFIAPVNRNIEVSEKGLKGKTVGAQRATIAAQWLEENYGKAVKSRLYDTQEAAYLDLAAGRINLIIADKYVSYDFLQTPEGKGFEFVGEPVFDNDKIGIAVRKEDDVLRDRMNEALKAILADGTYQKINERYFPFSIY